MLVQAPQIARPAHRFQPHTPKPPSVVLKQNLGPEKFGATMQDLLVAELEVMHQLRPHSSQRPGTPGRAHHARSIYNCLYIRIRVLRLHFKRHYDVCILQP